MYMINILNFIINHIVTSKEIKVTESEDLSSYDISGLGDETGKIIGKHGSIIKAIRNILSIAASKQNIPSKRYVKIIE